MHSRPLLILGMLLLTALAGALSSGAPSLSSDPSTWSTIVPPGTAKEDAVPAAPFHAPGVVRLDASAPAFGNEVRVSDSIRIGEPGAKVSPDGTVYVHAPGYMWTSKDGGASFTRAPLGDVILCGCDADIAVDDLNDVLFTDLAFQFGCTNVGFSPDHGNTWVTPDPSCFPGQDRQWITSSGLTHDYLSFRVGGNIYGYATQGPAPAFVPMFIVNQKPSNFRAGGIAAEHAQVDHAYFSYTSGNEIRVVTVLLGTVGGTLGSITNNVLHEDHLVATSHGSNLDSFSAVAVDLAGNVYVTWSDREGSVTNSYYASSTDQGATWSAPHKLNQAPVTTTYPWPVAGADGKVGFVYYGSSQATLPGSVTGDWRVYYTYTANGHDASPTLTEVDAVGHKVRTGAICTQGTGCGGGSRAFLDFFQPAIFPDGSVGIAYNDQETLTSSSSPYIHFIKQVDGPKLL